MDARLKFRDPDITADGAPRAAVALGRLGTLWFNTGTLCNITCGHCYIESSPKNDRLAYITLADVVTFLDEIAARSLGTEEVGLTGGEPFMNPEIDAILETCLARGFRTLVLTNAMKPMAHHREALLALRARFGEALRIRVSLDHYTERLHEIERGAATWAPTMEGIGWLAANGFAPAIAGRTRWGQDEAHLRAGYAALFASRGIALDCADPEALVLFPEMDEAADVPEITTACWDILHKSPSDLMCATSRMVVKRHDAPQPAVVACTLLPYDSRFELGATLAEAAGPVRLNHPHCAKFCVLGGGACSR
jgi:Radical SAM superfamily